MDKRGNVHVFTEGDIRFLKLCARGCFNCDCLCFCDVHKFYCRLGLPFVQVPCSQFVARMR